MYYLTDLLNMDIGDEINLTETKRLTRVPGGWICDSFKVSYGQTRKYTPIGCCFIPEGELKDSE